MFFSFKPMNAFCLFWRALGSSFRNQLWDAKKTSEKSPDLIDEILATHGTVVVVPL